MRYLSPRIESPTRRWARYLTWTWLLLIAAVGLFVCAMLPVGEAAAVDSASREEFHKELALVRNSPNPFNPNTTIYYNLLEPADVRIDVYDVKGHRVECLVDDWQDAGQNMAVWKTETAPSGTYIMALQADGVQVFLKMSLVR